MMDAWLYIVGTILLMVVGAAAIYEMIACTKDIKMLKKWEKEEKEELR